MANRRKVYGEDEHLDEHGARPCPVCGCRQVEVEREYRYKGRECVKKAVRRVCRNCGQVV